MSRQDNRVLARFGARELSIEEVDQVSAAMGHTNVCTAIMATATGSGDGDGCSDTDRDSNFI